MSLLNQIVEFIKGNFANKNASATTDVYGLTSKLFNKSWIVPKFFLKPNKNRHFSKHSKTIFPIQAARHDSLLKLNYIPKVYEDFKMRNSNVCFLTTSRITKSFVSTCIVINGNVITKLREELVRNICRRAGVTVCRLLQICIVYLSLTLIRNVKLL